MTVAFDAATDLGDDVLSGTHTPVGTPRCALVFVTQGTINQDQVSVVTYGGAAMGEVALSPFLSTTTGGDPDSTIYAYFLDNVAAGAQTVTVTEAVGTAIKLVTVITYTAAGACEVADTTTFVGESLTDPVTVTINCPASINCALALAAVGSANTLAGWNAQAGFTLRADMDMGATTTESFTKDTNSSGGDTAFLFFGGPRAAALGVAIRERVTHTGSAAIVGAGVFSATGTASTPAPAGPTAPEPGIAILPWAKGPLQREVVTTRIEVRRKRYHRITIRCEYSHRIVIRKTKILTVGVGLEVGAPVAKVSLERTVGLEPVFAFRKVATDASRAWVAERNREELTLLLGLFG